MNSKLLNDNAAVGMSTVAEDFLGVFETGLKVATGAEWGAVGVEVGVEVEPVTGASIGALKGAVQLEEGGRRSLGYICKHAWKKNA